MPLLDNAVFFNGVDISLLTAASLIDHKFNDLPDRELSMYKLARANKSIVTSAEYKSKEVTVLYHLRGCTRGDTEAVLVTLKSYIRAVNAPLIVSQGAIDTTYNNATLNELNYEWFSNKIIVTLVFTVADPIGFQNSDTSMLSTTVTNSTYSGAITNRGSFDAEPTINITVTTVTGGASQSMSVKNELTGQTLMITRTWANGDTVTINTSAKTVTINGAIADFTGQFPVFEPGGGIVRLH